MYKVYDIWPEIAEEAYNSNLEEVDFSGIDNILFAGMGGSGHVSSIFSSILSKTNIHVSVIKGYLLPKTVDVDTLVITTSISGNTTETLTVLNSANKLDCKTIAFTSGGKMEDYCIKNKIEHRKILQIHSPRASFTKFLYSMLKVLNPILPVEKQDIIESIQYLKETKEKISSNNLSKDNPSLSLAEWISGIPMIYYPAGLQAAAIRFKNSLHENSKIHAMAEDIVEACHNDIISWEKPSQVKPILIQGIDDYIKTKERWRIIKEYFDSRKINYYEAMSVKGSILTKLINLIYLLDFSTIYYAALSKIDPSPIDSINFVKSRL